jgi:methylenetetrahydrofolate reductase (NADPH)
MGNNGQLKSGSRLESLIHAGEFVITAELGPPKSCDLGIIEKKAGHLKGNVDAVNVTDNQTAIVRMASIAVGKLLVDRDIEPIIQMTCRDRNRIAIQADVLGAYAMGIKNILCLTGDHQIFGNHPTAKHVYDLDSIQLIDMLRKMRDEKKFLCGEDVRNTKKQPVSEPKMYIGGAANPFGDPFEYRPIRLAKKVKAGVDFIQTQCIYDMKKFREWMKRITDMELTEKCKILAGITPLKSVPMAKYMATGVAGVSVPDEIISRLEGATVAADEGINIACEQIAEFREMPGIAGVHLMAIEWEHRVQEIAERAGLLPRPVVKET